MKSNNKITYKNISKKINLNNYAKGKGITLIALVITIIVLLILAGVTIMIVIGPNGLLKKAEETAKMHKIQELTEKLEIEKGTVMLENKGKVGIEKYLAHIVKEGIIEEGNIVETEKEKSKLVTIENKYVFLIEETENGELQIGYVGETGKVSPQIEIEVEKIETNEIGIKVKASNMGKGTYKYYIKEIETGEEYKLKESKQGNEYIFTGLKQNKEYRIKVEASNIGTQTKETGIIRTITLEELVKEDIEFTYSKQGWTKESITVTASANKEIPNGYRIQTSKDASNWEDTTSQTFTENGEMYARLYDGLNKTGEVLAEVSKIDTKKPSITQAKPNTESIEITATDEASGIIGYAITSKNIEPTEFTSVNNTKALNIEVKGLSQGATYYVWVKDEAGNISESKQVTTIKLEAGDIIKTENNIKYTSDGAGGIIPVPVGFSYAGVGTKETGFVIKNDADLNEFVWIPTDLVTYQTYDWNKGSAATSFREYYTSDEVENTRIINEVTKSVSDNKGYYISRYEAGVITKRTAKTTVQTELPSPIFKATSSTTPVYVYNYVEWEDAIYIGNNLYNKEKGSNVTSRLINSRGWDTALKFIETVGEDKDPTYPTDLSGKGWYWGNYRNNANHEIGKSVDLTNNTFPNKLKNIYDMGGNTNKWMADQSIVNNRSGYALRRM